MIRLIIEVPQFIMIIIDGEPEETPKIFHYYSEPFWHSRESWQPASGRDAKDVAYLDSVSKYEKRFMFETESS